MKELVYQPRQFYPDELRILKTLKTKKEKTPRGRIKFYHYLIAALCGVLFIWLAVLINGGFFSIVLGTMAVFAWAFIVFMPWEAYKYKKRNASFLKELNVLIEKGTVNTSIIYARQVAVAKEYEDEGDLFIVEKETNELLFLWDHDYNLRKKLPCLNFEVYEEKFYQLTGRQVYPRSEQIVPVSINKKAKWEYMSKVGLPGHLEIKAMDFETFITAVKSCG